jgi:crotonobetainyl-CoA:carnitine CoA-transferase CaiB-like acyl-CoA transferase
MLLALHGADVIKIEPPGGDWGRVLGRSEEQNSLHFISFNRGKRSLAVDLAKPASRPLLNDLLAGAQVVVESFRPGVAQRLGLGLADIQKQVPNIIYMSVSGYGQSGPNRERPTVDGVIQAFSGMMVMNGSLSKPHRQSMVAIDTVTGLYGFQALSAALMRQFRFGEGAVLDVNLMQSAAAFQAVKLMEAQADGPSPGPPYSPSGVFETADGHILISAMRQRNFEVLCEVLGCPQLAHDPKLASMDLRNGNRQEMNAILQARMHERTTREWIPLLLSKGVMASEINTYADWLADDHVREVKAYDIIPFRGFGDLPVAAIPGCPSPKDVEQAAHVPALGEHSREILDELGWPKARIDDLYANGVLV